MKQSALWWIGQVVAVAIGIAVHEEYGSAAGVSVTYALMLLVDIRGLLEAHNAIELTGDPLAGRPR